MLRSCCPRRERRERRDLTSLFFNTHIMVNTLLSVMYNLFAWTTTTTARYTRIISRQQRKGAAIHTAAAAIHTTATATTAAAAAAFAFGCRRRRHHHNHHRIRRVLSSFRPGLFVSSFSSTSLYNDNSNDSSRSQHQYLARLPVGIFMDLDNVGPELYGRHDVQDFLKPFVHMFDSSSNRDNFNSQIETFQAFGNRATQTYITAEEKAAEFDQAWDSTAAVTGLDDTGILRCGVCGARMSLTKKQKKAGLTPERKLQRHMKQLHDREQAKRMNRYLNNNNNGSKKKKKKGSPKKKRIMSEKEFQKYQKYNSAQIGLARLGLKGRQQQQQQQHASNDLFQVLKEQGIRVYSAQDVDASLRSNAVLWMHSILRQNDNNKLLPLPVPLPLLPPQMMLTQ